MSKSQLRYDHSFTPDQGHRFLKKLQKMGFNVEKTTVEHPGKSFCRFIKFDNFTYLEFVWVKSNKATNKKSGLSFEVKGSLENYYKNRIVKMKIPSQFVHKNYDWKNNSKDRLPGWNFVSFKQLPMRKLYPWITEYESTGKPPRKRGTNKHANGVIGISAIYLECNQKGRQFFESLLGKIKSDEILLANDIKLKFIPARTTKLTSIELKCKNMAKFKRVSGLKSYEDDQGEYCLISNPSGFQSFIVRTE